MVHNYYTIELVEGFIRYKGNKHIDCKHANINPRALMTRMHAVYK